MIEKIAIMGAGSLGTILGAFVAKNGYDVTLVDANVEHVKALNEKGAHVVGEVDFVQPVKACVPEDMEGTYDLFIYMAKQTVNEIAIPQMVAHCHDKTIICSCQNGIPEFAVAKYWPEELVCGAAVGWGAVWMGPGESKLVNQLADTNFHLGTLAGPVAPWIEDVKKVLESMAIIFVTEDLMADRWAKVTINAAFSGLGTVMGCDYGGIFDDAEGLRISAMLCNECVRVARGLGTRMASFHVDWDKDCYIETVADVKNAEEAIVRDFSTRRGIYPSMLQDLEKGRKCEIHQLNGLVSEKGAELGIPTPYNDLVVKIVSEMEEGKRKPGKEHLADFAVIDDSWLK